MPPNYKILPCYCLSYSILERLGLSSSEAHRRLVTGLRELTGRNANYRRWIVGVFLPPYRFVNALLTHVGAIALLVSYVDTTEWTLLVEGIILLLLGTVNFYLLVRENYYTRTGCLRKLKGIIQELLDNTPSCHYPSEPIATARGHLTVSVLRDYVTVNLPTSLLVEGDVVLLAANQICPANVTKVNHDNVQLLKGDAVTEDILDSGSNAFFEVTETPLLSAFQSAISHQKDATILESERNHVYKIIHVYLFWALLLLLVILGLIKQISLSDDSGTWSEVVLRLPTYSVLPLLLLPFPLYWWLGNCFALAKLSFLIDDRKPTIMQLLIKMLKFVFNYNSDLNYSFLHFLGTVTTFCAVDKEYLLSSSHPIPEKVFFFRGTEVSTDSHDSSPSKNDTNLPNSKSNSNGVKLHTDEDGQSLSESSAGDYILIEAEILQISPSQDSHSGIFFDNSEWRRYFSSLNPIALCSRLTSHVPKVPHIDVHLSEHLRHTQCSCPLAVEVGIADLDFKPSTIVFVVDNKRRIRSTSSMFQLTHSDNIPIHMISTVIQGKEYSQLMSAGSAHMILSCCSDLWDGQDLIPMTSMECKKVMDFFSRRSVASYCIGLAYNPLLEQIEPMQPVYVIKEPDQQVPKQLQGQVFLGMLSLQYQPAPDMVQLVEQLDIAGVRFVHFTAENELQIRWFTEKLGLEVGWNCHISLSPDMGENGTHEDDANEQRSINSSNSSISLAVNDFEAYNRAKLPKGVKLIRSHIKNVDNVPLLVPLFTDCTASSIAEMMLIMQENDEIVVCIGSSWNTDNIAIFSQANVSIAVEPVDSSSGSRSPTPDGTLTQLQAASLLNGCPCDLVIPHNPTANILSMILHSRHLLSCLRQSLLFGLGSSLLLTSLLVSSNVMFLPPAVNGSHVFWFLFFVMPIISSSLLVSSPNEEELKNKIMDKNNKLWIKQWRFVFYYVCSFFSTAIVCLLLFAITLDNICSEISSGDCHPLLGNRNESSQWNGWQDEYSGGLLLAQNVTAFFFCCYLIILSFHFSLQIIPIRSFHRSLQLPWLAVIIFVLLLQVVFFAISLVTVESPDSHLRLSLVPVWVWPIGVAWAFVLVVIQEVIKLRERKLMLHTQKHLRLEFETKLGMNSPF